MARAVLVVGSFNVDHVWTLDRLPVPGETRSGRYGSGPGGKGFNQAVAAARAGARTRFVCALGEDAGGQLARALAVADGIDLRDAASPLPTGSAGIFVDADGRNSIVVAPGANGSLAAAHVAHELAGERPEVVLAQLETPAAAAEVAFARGRSVGALTVLNPAPADARPGASLLDLVDVLTPNETEFAALLQAGPGADVDAASLAALGDEALHGLCRRLLPGGTVVVTLGVAGCFVSHANGRLRGDRDAHYRVPALRVQPVDTTGAGDAFNGALCAALAAGAAFHRAIAFASAYASVSTERPGAASGMPFRAEVESRMDPTVA